MSNHGYLKDPQWYLAFVAGIGFWFLVNYFVLPANPQNLLNTPDIILFSILLYPLLEEIVFRGLIQGQLMWRLYWGRCYLGISRANLVTSSLFALLHTVYQASLMSVLVIFPSLIFGYFRDRHRSVYPSIWLHVFYNAGFFTLFYGVSLDVGLN